MMWILFRMHFFGLRYWYLVMLYHDHPRIYSPTSIEQMSVDQALNKIRLLTNREIEILHYIVAGEHNKVIAHKLKISQRTVENHRNRIMHKTDCHSQSALTCLFILTVKECLPHCMMTKRCNQSFSHCHININILQK